MSCVAQLPYLSKTVERQQFLLVFLRTNAILCTKNKLAIVRRVQFLTGRRAVRSFSPAAVATIALLWKSAPIYGGRALQFGDVRT